MEYELPEWLRAINQALLDADTAITENRQTWDLAEIADYVGSLNELKATFGIVYDALTSLLSERMGQMPEITTSTGMKIEKKMSTGRKAWQHADLAQVVAQRLADMSIDLDTGEVTMSSQQIAEKMLEFVQPSYWRIKPLEQIGINPDHFCEVGDTKEGIIVRKAMK